MLKKSSKTVLPVLPLRNIVVFPHMVVPLLVGRDKSVHALEEVMDDDDRKILLVTQKDANQDEPGPEDIYEIGTIGTVLQLLKLPDGTVKVLVEATQRVRIVGFTDNEAFFEAEAEFLQEEVGSGTQFEALTRAVVDQFDQYSKLNQKIHSEIVTSLAEVSDAGKLADAIATHVSLKIAEKQQLLETLQVQKRLEKLYGILENEIGLYKVEKKIRTRVKKQMEKSQREYYLNEQLRAIQKELNDEEELNETQVLESRIVKAKMPKEVRDKAVSELKKLKNMSQMSAEATVVRNYLDWLLDVPWSKRTKTSHDLKKAEKILDEGHYGLDKIKERILEFLAVQSRQKKIKGPILCLVGPPGVGKTSLGKSIAESVGRNFVRVSLGGMRDEAEIRGHRRTYVGSMPGKIIQGMKKAKSTNPLMMLDEIDKLGADWRGDPSAALLEVLDPEQNKNFNDHYMEVDYDLSDVLFIATANTLNLPRPLLDRMEVIRISGYTEDEKLEIVKRHLLEKQVKENGLKKNEMTVSDEALRHMIRRYTKEAGVRNIERELSKLCRKIIKDIEMGAVKKTPVVVTRKNLEKYLGVTRFKDAKAEEESRMGVTTGLAWTEVGGELLLIEAVTMPGRGKVTCSGKLGEVMKESITAAECYVKSRCIDFGIKPTIFKKRDIHVHVPEGATPKDGPSAGAAMVTTIVSVLTGVKVRHDVAMTGEISLRGRILPIGGLKEKLLAAHQGGIKMVLIPKDNEKDLAEVPDNVKKDLDIRPVSTVDEVLGLALESPLIPIEWTEKDDEADDLHLGEDDDAETRRPLAH